MRKSSAGRAYAALQCAAVSIQKAGRGCLARRRAAAERVEHQRQASVAFQLAELRQKLADEEGSKTALLAAHQEKTEGELARMRRERDEARAALEAETYERGRVVAADAAASDKLRLELASSRANESALRKQLAEAHAATERVAAELAAERAASARRRSTPTPAADRGPSQLRMISSPGRGARRAPPAARDLDAREPTADRRAPPAERYGVAAARQLSHVAPQPVVGAAASRVAGAGTGAARGLSLNLHAVVDAVAPSPPPTAAAAAGALEPPGGATRLGSTPPPRDAAAGGFGVGRRVVAAGCLACGAAGDAARTPESAPATAADIAAGVVAAGGWPTRLCSEGGRLNGAALTSDGRRLWSAADERGAMRLRVWSVDTAQCERTHEIGVAAWAVCAHAGVVYVGAADGDPPLPRDGGAAGRALRGRRHQARPRARGRAARAAGVAARRRVGARARTPPPLRRRRRLRARLRAAPPRRRPRAAPDRGDEGAARRRRRRGAGGVTSVRALAACQLPSEGLPGAAGRALLAGGDEGVVRAFSLRDGGGCGEAQGAPVAAGASIHALASLGVGKAAAALDSGALLVLRAALTQPPAHGWAFTAPTVSWAAVQLLDGHAAVAWTVWRAACGGGVAVSTGEDRKLLVWADDGAGGYARAAEHELAAPACCVLASGSALLACSDDGLVALFSTDGSARRRRPWLPPSLRRRRNRGRPPPARRRRPTTDGRGVGSRCAR